MIDKDPITYKFNVLAKNFETLARGIEKLLKDQEETPRDFSLLFELIEDSLKDLRSSIENSSQAVLD